MNRFLSPPVLALFFVLGSASLSPAQLAVYKLTFDAAGETINYRPYQGGYYIAPIEGGTGSLILTTTTSAGKQYYTYANFGELFVAVKGDVRKTVLSATAANTVSTTTFFAIGDADERMELETRSSEGDVFVAKDLKGYAVSADSERDLPYASSSATDIGVAGVSYLRATLDEGLTENAIDNQRALADEVTEIETQLQDKGYTSGLTTTTSTTTGTGTTGTGTSTTTPPTTPTTGTTTPTSTSGASTSSSSSTTTR